MQNKSNAKNMLVPYVKFLFEYGFLGPFQTSLSSCAEPNAN